MESVKEFIYRNREQLLRYLDGEAPSTHVDPGPRAFVDGVVAEWSTLFGGKKIQAPTRRERTFWYTLYLFEEMQEIPPGSQSDPFVTMQRKSLTRLRELLRMNLDLPPEFHATRPDEEPEDWSDLDEEWEEGWSEIDTRSCDG